MKINAWRLAAVLVMLLSACNLPTTGGIDPTPVATSTPPRTWIDAPLEGQNLPLAPYQVVFHGAAEDGVQRAEFRVGGLVETLVPDPEVGLSLVVFHVTWTPPGPGQYRLQVRTLDQSGQWGEFAAVTVTVGTTATSTPSPTLSPTITPTLTQVPSATPSPSATIATPTETRVATPQVEFGLAVAPSTFYTGSCGPNQLDIQVSVNAEAGIANLFLFYRLDDPATWSEALAMSPAGVNHYRYTLAAASIPGLNAVSQAQVFLQFAATDGDGNVQARSQVFTGASLQSCQRVRPILTPTLKIFQLATPTLKYLQLATPTRTPVVVK